MDDLLNKEPVKRAQDALQRFDKSLKVKVLEKTARTAQDASLALRLRGWCNSKKFTF